MSVNITFPCQIIASKYIKKCYNDIISVKITINCVITIEFVETHTAYVRKLTMVDKDLI